MKMILFILFLFIKSFSIQAQTDICGTKTGDKPIIFTKEQQDKINTTFAINQPYAIKIWVTVFANDNGTNRAATDANIRRQVQNMSNQYQTQNICFILMGITQVNNSDLNDHNVTSMPATDESAEVLPFNVAGFLNIFIHNTMPGLFGIAFAIPASILSMRSDAMASTNMISILSHEMGHCLGLYHTFEPWTNSAGVATNRENVDRNGACKNCTTGGDVLCDTPADRNDGYNPNNCTYTGTTLDACSTAYTPLLNNIMSYYNFCSNTFTAEQGARMRGFLLTNPTLNSFLAQDVLYLPTSAGLTYGYPSGNLGIAARDLIVICNFANNVYDVSGSAIHTIVSRKVVLKPGTRLHPNTGRVQITSNPYCN
jgi:Pregnancy-associated plasma protein-A